MSSFKVTKDTIISDLLTRYPAIAKDVFHVLKLDCLECKAMKTETIERAAVNHGLDLGNLLHDINRKICDLNG